jgi:hypothetical protein
MKKALAVAALALTTFSSTAVLAASRSQVIHLASQLSARAYDVSDYAQGRGYFNTASKTFEIAGYADEVEDAARFGTKFEAEFAVNQIVHYYISLRPNINAIPYISERLYIKRVLRTAINQLGHAMFGSGWQSVYAGCDPASDPQVCEERSLDEIREGQPTGEDWGTDQNSGGDHDIGGGGGDDGWEP